MQAPFHGDGQGWHQSRSIWPGRSNSWPCNTMTTMH